MAENELDGFDNLDDLFGEDKAAAGGAAPAGGAGVGNLLGDAPAAGAEAPAAGGTGFELGSFF